MLVVANKGSAERDRMLRDPLIDGFARDPQGSLDALKVMNFVTEDPNGHLQITQNGREFLAAF